MLQQPAQCLITISMTIVVTTRVRDKEQIATKVYIEKKKPFQHLKDVIPTKKERGEITVTLKPTARNSDNHHAKNQQ